MKMINDFLNLTWGVTNLLHNNGEILDGYKEPQKIIFIEP